MSTLRNSLIRLAHSAAPDSELRRELLALVQERPLARTLRTLIPRSMQGPRQMGKVFISDVGRDLTIDYGSARWVVSERPDKLSVTLIDQDGGQGYRNVWMTPQELAHEVAKRVKYGG